MGAIIANTASIFLRDLIEEIFHLLGRKFCKFGVLSGNHTNLDIIAFEFLPNDRLKGNDCHFYGLYFIQIPTSSLFQLLLHKVDRILLLHSRGNSFEPVIIAGWINFE